jgi:hypothetical protein
MRAKYHTQKHKLLRGAHYVVPAKKSNYGVKSENCQEERLKKICAVFAGAADQLSFGV